MSNTVAASKTRVFIVGKVTVMLVCSYYYLILNHLTPNLYFFVGCKVLKKVVEPTRATNTRSKLI